MLVGGNGLSVPLALAAVQISGSWPEVIVFDVQALRESESGRRILDKEMCPILLDTQIPKVRSGTLGRPERLARVSGGDGGRVVRERFAKGSCIPSHDRVFPSSP